MAKKTASMKVVKKQDDTQESIDEMKAQLTKMVEDRDAKCEAAKKQLIDMLNVTADKYYTATGVAEALRVLRFTAGEDKASIDLAIKLAKSMAEETLTMCDHAINLEYVNMDLLCDGHYEKRFESFSEYDLAYEMMRIDLCRNVGGAAEDMVEFIKRADEEIAQTVKAIEELEKE